MILREAAESHPDVASRIRKVADEDTVHRKIFVHGLGWDSTADSLRTAFSQYGEIEDCKTVTDKISGKSKGCGFILFKSRLGARYALQNPQKKIGGRMTSCQLAAVGPVSTSSTSFGVVKPEVPASECTQRKIYVSNVSADIDPKKLTAYFGKFGEIEDGPLGLDKQTGKPKGFCLFVCKSVESAKKALEEPHQTFDGHVLHCQKAVDRPKHGKQQMGQGRGQHYGRRVDNPNFSEPYPSLPLSYSILNLSIENHPFISKLLHVEFNIKRTLIINFTIVR
ncbi:UBP1-associated protein 2A-like [Amaranthus tricolor]|uniref:UBP1-associated protein 2A-like n=1 Tax=Amaranthus tricolor TaxID=29722 RepID=UPI002584E2E4|nr:UBP1-associated protein 2A-like [Amaranthus tricolor]